MTTPPTPPAVASALDLIGATPMVELTGFDAAGQWLAFASCRGL